MAVPLRLFHSMTIVLPFTNGNSTRWTLLHLTVAGFSLEIASFTLILGLCLRQTALLSDTHSGKLIHFSIRIRILYFNIHTWNNLQSLRRFSQSLILKFRFAFQGNIVPFKLVLFRLKTIFSHIQSTITALFLFDQIPDELSGVLATESIGLVPRQLGEDMKDPLQFQFVQNSNHRCDCLPISARKDLRQHPTHLMADGHSQRLGKLKPNDPAKFKGSHVKNSLLHLHIHTHRSNNQWRETPSHYNFDVGYTYKCYYLPTPNPNASFRIIPPFQHHTFISEIVTADIIF